MLADFFSILLGSFSRQIAYNPLGRDRSIADTVRNSDASIAGACEDQSPIATECCFNLVQPFEMSQRILRHGPRPAIDFHVYRLGSHAADISQFFPDSRYQGLII